MKIKKNQIPNQLFVYTDGSCLKNPGPGGWGFAVFTDNTDFHPPFFEDSGGEAETTNNRMELMAATMALDFLCMAQAYTAPGAPKVTACVFTDSQYVQKGITEWISGWKARGWKTAGKKPVLNQDLWVELDAAKARVEQVMNLSWAWVKAHSVNPMNNHVDETARQAALAQQRKNKSNGPHPKTPHEQHQQAIEEKSPPNGQLAKPRPANKNAGPKEQGAVYLNVPFAQKETVKGLGARWSAEKKKWYAPPGANLDLFAAWM